MVAAALRTELFLACRVVLSFFELGFRGLCFLQLSLRLLCLLRLSLRLFRLLRLSLRRLLRLLRLSPPDFFVCVLATARSTKTMLNMHMKCVSVQLCTQLY
eukprot:SAG31_NODE_2884_length_4954_cov_2.669619_2_plen_101_part_00